MLQYGHSRPICNSLKLGRTQMFLHGRMDTEKMWDNYTMENYLAIKTSEFLKFLGKWVEQDNIMLSEKTQSQKNTHCIHSLIVDISPEA